MNRRLFLIGGATAAGALVVGYGLWPSGRLARANLLASKAGERFVGSWIKIADDDTVTIVIPHCDMGTGIFTSLSQMAADELDADWDKVRAETAPADSVFANAALVEGFLLTGRKKLIADSLPGFLKGIESSALRAIAAYKDVQITGGSSAVRMTGEYGMRAAGAAAREMLLKAAAARMSAPLDAFRTRLSRVIHMPSGRSFGYGELAAAAALYDPSFGSLKPKSEYRLVGKPVARFDIPDKVNGGARYGIDAGPPEVCYAAIKIAPVFGGKLVSVSEDAIAHRPGVKKVVRLDDAVVVVADRFWRAQRAIDALDPVFDAGGNAQVTSAIIRDRQLAALTKGEITRERMAGIGADALNSGALVESVYRVPYLAHAAMEPVNATAHHRRDGMLEVWAGTQDGLGSRAFCAQAAGMKPHQVVFHLLPSGGAFGRRLPGLWNFLAYAVQTAMAVPGVPVKLIFTREQDMQHDYYRPQVTSRFRAPLDADGMPLAWVNDYTTDDKPSAEAHIFYDVPNQAYGAVKAAAHVPTGPWRSVEASWHGFFIESFIDELAHRAHRDPLDYRRALLRGKPRHLATLNLAAEKAGWGAALPAGRARGIAMVECFGTIVAHVAEVSVTDDGALKVHAVTSAADCGMAVNPDGFRAQIEGAIVFGLAAARYGEISIDRGAVVQRNFPDYRQLLLADCPSIEVHIHESGAPLGGGGEPGVPPVAPALTNAIFAATGIRIRELPIANHPLGKTVRSAAG